MKDVSAEVYKFRSKAKSNSITDAILHVLDDDSPVKDLRDLRHHSSIDTADGPIIRDGVHDDEWIHFLLAVLKRLLDDL